jgi:hypothetical protein
MVGLFVLASLTTSALYWMFIRTDVDFAAVTKRWTEDYRPKTVVGKTFRNEVIILDGTKYVGCTFENVTFKYNGTTPIQLSGNQVSGTIRLATDNPAISAMSNWLYAVNAFGKDVEVDVNPLDSVEKIRSLPN